MIQLRHGFAVEYGDSGIILTVTKEGIIAALNAAPAPVREDIGVEVYDIPKAIEDVRVRKLEDDVNRLRVQVGGCDRCHLAHRAEVERLTKERDDVLGAMYPFGQRYTGPQMNAANQRATDAEKERDAAIARAEKAEAKLKEEESDRWSRWGDLMLLFGATNEESPMTAARRVLDGLNARAEKAEATAESRLAECNRLQWESDCLRRRHEKAAEDRDGWRRGHDRLQRELAEAKATPILRDQTGNWHDAHSATDLPLAPGSYWEGSILRSSNGSDLRVETYHDEPIIELAPEEDGRWCKVRDVLAVLARAGLLPQGDGVPRERVREMLAKAARNGWSAAKIAISEPHTSLGTDVAGLVLADYDRTKEPAR